MNYNLLILLTLLIFTCEKKFSVVDYNLVIQNVKLFDGDSVYENSTLLIKGDSITNILFEKTNFQGANVFDGTGKTLIPGLINSHVHAEKEADLIEAAKAGVLTLIDLFNFSEPANTLKKASFTENNLAYYYWAGPTVTVPGGHGTQYGTVPLIYNADEIAGFIYDRKNEGADFIKIILETGWVPERTLPSLNDEMLQTALSYCSEKDLISIVHISQISDAVKIAKFGGKGLAHIWRKDSIGITDEDLSILAESDIFIIPTMMLRRETEIRDQGRYHHTSIEQLKVDLLRLHEIGVPILAGNDPPNQGINYGTDLYEELHLFVQAGLSPLEALKTATSIPADELKLGQRGRVKTGFTADFVLINGDPTLEIKDIAKISNIWKRGK